MGATACLKRLLLGSFDHVSRPKLCGRTANDRQRNSPPHMARRALPDRPRAVRIRAPLVVPAKVESDGQQFIDLHEDAAYRFTGMAAKD